MAPVSVACVMSIIPGDEDDDDDDDESDSASAATTLQCLRACVRIGESKSTHTVSTAERVALTASTSLGLCYPSNFPYSSTRRVTYRASASPAMGHWGTCPLKRMAAV